MAMDLIERYVQEVGRALPCGKRADIERELRSLLQDSLESRGGPDHGDEEAVQIELLQEFGPPEELARSYVSRPRWLVGPRYFSGFWIAVRISAVVALIVWIQALVGLADWSGGLSTLFPSAIKITAQILSSLFSLIGLLTLTFVLLERYLEEPQVDPKSWNPRVLPPVRGPSYAGRSASLVRAGLAVCALAVLNLSPGTIGGGFVSIGDERGFVPLLGPGMIAAIPWLDAILLAELLVALALLRKGCWSLSTRIADGAVKLFWVATLAGIASGGRLHVDAAWLVAHGWSEKAASSYSSLVHEVLHGQVHIVLLVAAGLTAVLAALRIMKHFKEGRGDGL